MNTLDSAEHKYAVGSVLMLNNSATLRLRIQSHIAVRQGRRSQIFIAIVEEGETASDIPLNSALPQPNSRVCVKIFDHDLAEVNDNDWIGSPAEFCSHFFCPYHAIVFEYVDQLNLSNYSVRSEEEMKLLEAMGTSAIERLHANGVYHGDIRGSNILWSSSTQRLVLLDIEMSLVFDGKEDHVIEVWKELDHVDLNYVLGKCRVKVPQEIPLYP